MISNFFIDVFSVFKCRVETWGGALDDTAWPSSINNNAVPGNPYEIEQHFSDNVWTNYNPFGEEGVSNARIIGSGCVVKFKDNSGTTRCTLSSGDYAWPSFANKCGNDVVTQYTVQPEEGRVFSLN